MNESKPPKTWLVESILATILCCLPFGVVGIINAAKVESRFYAGDIAGAEHASKEAGKWTKIAAVVGIVVIILSIVFNGAVFLAALSGEGGY
ncbi:MAG: CD225/dispanin family protein [Cyclobacteriaceae bacterium]